MPFNLVNGIVQNTISGLKYFNDLINEKGFIGALDSLASSIFSRKTLESILNAGGLGGLLGSSPKTPVTLPDGSSGYVQSLGDGSALLYDASGKFIGKTEGGITQIGAFGTNQNGKWGLINGKVTAVMDDGAVFTADVHNGQMYGGAIKDSTGVQIGEFNPEGGQGPIIIAGPGPEAQSSSGNGFWDMAFKFLPMGMEFLFGNGALRQVNTQINSSNVASQGSKPFFILTNGINNQNLSLTTPPDYINNLEHDLYEGSLHQILYNDMIPTPIYQGTKITFNRFASDLNSLLNQAKDILQVIWEGEISFPNSFTTLLVMTHLAGAFGVNREVWKKRPAVAVGYSGGFLPMVEAVNSLGLNVTGLVGLGAATVDIAKIPQAMLMGLGEIIGKIQNGVTDGLRTLLENTIGLIPGIGQFLVLIGTTLLDLINSIFNLASDQSTAGSALQMLGNIVQTVFGAIPGIGTATYPESVEYVVNVWGQNDILSTLGVGGYRDELHGYTPSDNTKTLLNIEILSTSEIVDGETIQLKADHFNYMRLDDTDYPVPANAHEALVIEARKAWDRKVSRFVSDMLIKANESGSALKDFLDGAISDPRVRSEIRDGHAIYVVRPA